MHIAKNPDDQSFLKDKYDELYNHLADAGHDPQIALFLLQYFSPLVLIDFDSRNRPVLVHFDFQNEITRADLAAQIEIRKEIIKRDPTTAAAYRRCLKDLIKSVQIIAIKREQYRHENAQDRTSYNYRLLARYQEMGRFAEDNWKDLRFDNKPRYPDLEKLIARQDRIKKKKGNQNEAETQYS